MHYLEKDLQELIEKLKSVLPDEAVEEYESNFYELADVSIEEAKDYYDTTEYIEGSIEEDEALEAGNLTYTASYEDEYASDNASFLFDLQNEYEFSNEKEIDELIEEIYETVDSIVSEAKNILASQIEELKQEKEVEALAWREFYEQDWVFEICGMEMIVSPTEREGRINDDYHRTISLFTFCLEYFDKEEAERIASEVSVKMDEDDINYNFEVRVKDHAFGEGAGKVYGHRAPDFELVIDEEEGVDNAQAELDEFLDNVSDELTEIIKPYIEEYIKK